jgi:hypothetical protein
MKQIAQTILEQLGGRRFLVMTGAKDLLAGENYLSMRLPASLTKGRVNKIRILLADNDTYTLETYKFTTRDLASASTPVRQESDVYVESLRETFTAMTGLAVSL